MASKWLPISETVAARVKQTKFGILWYSIGIIYANFKNSKFYKKNSK